MIHSTFLLPTQVENIQTERPIKAELLEGMLDKYRINWDVKKQPLFINNSGINIQTDFFGVVRQDTQKTFQACSKQYTPFQNSQVMELAMTIADACETEVTACKMIHDGAIIYITIEGRRFDMKATNVGDVVSEQIMITNSHNGKSSLRISFGHLILSCTNGMTRFDKKGSFSIRHTQSMKNRLEAALNGLHSITNESTHMIETYKRLADKRIKSEDVQNVLGIITGYDPNMPAEKVSTRGMNTMKTALTSLTTEMSYKGQTAWGLLNGATHYTTQLAGTSDSKLASKMFGETAKREMSVWDYLTKDFN